MGDWANSKRYMQRQWKRNKPYLPPCDSLPTLRLCPSRPLFVCARCGFANAWIPLCLWCEWTSTEATKQFEANLPRPRRLSVPSRAVHAPKKAKQRPRRKMSADSAISSVASHTRDEQTLSSIHSAEAVPGITTVLEAFHRDLCHNGSRVDPHNVERMHRASVSLSVASTNPNDVQKEAVDGDGGGLHQVATATSITPPLPTSSFPNVAPGREVDSSEHNSEDQEVKRNSRRHWRKLPALCLHPSSARFRASRCSVATAERAERGNATATQAMDSATSVLMNTSCLPRSTGSLDLSDGGGMHSTPSISSSQCSPQRGLRRTKNMTSLKRGSSISHRSRSPLRGSMDIYPTSAVESRHSHALSLALSQDYDAPPVRLGHPSRPYYSAIRKDMSRPTSPVFSINAPRTPSPISPHVDHVPRGTKSLDCGDRSGIPYARPMSMVLSRQATPPNLGSGFSLSGEMELRMNLARWRRENTPDEPGGYHFQEMSPSQTKVNLKRRVKQLGRGLKDLVLGRS